MLSISNRRRISVKKTYFYIVNNAALLRWWTYCVRTHFKCLFITLSPKTVFWTVTCIKPLRFPHIRCRSSEMNSAQPTNSLAAPSTTYTALKLLQHALIQCLTLHCRDPTSREKKKPQQQQQHHHKHLFISSCTHTSIKAVTHSQSVCLTNCFALISFFILFF